MPDSVERFKDGIEHALDKADADSLWKIRSELQRLKASLSSGSRTADEQLMRRMDRLLEINKSCHDFSVEMKAKLAAESLNKLATLFDIGAIGSLAGQDFLTGDILDVGKLMMGTLSEVMTIMGSMQYTESWGGECESLIGEHALRVYDLFWALPGEFDFKIKDESLPVIQEGLDRFFDEIRNKETPQAVRLIILQQLYVLLFKLYLNRFLRRAERL